MIVVVGGGITGLAVAAELDQLGVECLVLEATERPGGVIRSAEVDGRVLDWGPQRSRLTPPFRALVDALGLCDELVVAPPDLDLSVYRDGALRRVPMSFGEMLNTDLVGPAAKARLLLEPLTRAADPDESVARYFRRKIGDELYEAVVGPLFGGLYGSDPADMEVGRTLADVLDRLGIERSLLAALLRRGEGRAVPPACSFRSGMQALPDALAARLGDRLRLGTPVRTVTEHGAGWRVSLDGSPEQIDAEAVVVTVPADAAAALVHDVAPALADALGRLRYNPLGLVHLDVDAELPGLGFQVALDERASLLRGVTFNANIFPETRRGLCTAFLGGSHHPAVAAMSTDHLADEAVRAFRETTGEEVTVLAAETTRMPAWDRSWSALDGVTPPRGLHLAGNWWSRPGLPGRFTEARRVAESVARGRGRDARERPALTTPVVGASGCG